jgi:hypothetical protein
MMQITLLDHFIIGDGSFSFADEGLMASIREDVSQAIQKTISAAR